MSSTLSWMSSTARLAEQPLRDVQRDEAPLRIDLVQAQAEESRDAQPARARNHPHRRQRPLGREDRHGVAHSHRQLRGQILPNQNAVRFVFGPRGQRVQAAAPHRADDVGDLRLERRIDALDLNRQRILAGGDQALTEDLRRRADDVRHLAQLLGLRVVVGDAARVPDVDVRVGADDAIAQLLLESGHQRQRDDQRHDADRHAERRDERDDRDERLLALGEQIAERDVEFEGDVHLDPFSSSAETG